MDNNPYSPPGAQPQAPQFPQPQPQPPSQPPQPPVQPSYHEPVPQEPPKPEQPLKKPARLSRKQLLIFIAVFGIIGGIVLWKSFAAPAPSPPHTSQFEGDLQMLHSDDIKAKSSTINYFLVGASGIRTQVNFKAGEFPDLAGTAHVQIKGVLTKGRIEVSSAADAVVQQVTTVPDTPRKTAVVLFNFTDDKTQGVTPTGAKHAIFTNPQSTNSFFKEESYGHRSLVGIKDPTGDVFGYYTLNAAHSSCDFWGWANTVNAAALAQGVDLSAYDNVQYITSPNACPYAGVAEVGGHRSWVFSWDLYNVYGISAHELTHNFGTWHANSMTCYTDQTRTKLTLISDSAFCTSYEYGDSFDVMGFGAWSPYHTNSYFKNELGWLSKDQVQTVTQSGDYALTPQEINTPGIKAIRLIRSIDKFNTYQYEYLEYRQPYGFDNFTPGNQPVDGVSVRLTSGYKYYVASFILNARIDGQIGRYTIGDGKTFQDKDHFIKVTQVSHDSQKATVHIDVSKVPQPDTTAPSAPTNLAAGDTSTKFISLSWKTSPEADVSYYTVYQDGHAVGRVYPPGSGKAPDPTKANLLTFTYQGNFKPESVIAYTVKAVDFADNISAASAPLQITVPKKDTQAPSAPQKLTLATGTYGERILKWLPSTDNNKVYGYLVYRVDKDGIVSRFDTRIYNSNPLDTTFTDWWNTGASSTYYVKAYDSDLNFSAISNKVKI